MHIILASGSPRRRDLLAQADLKFEVMSADIDERVADNELPVDYIKRMVANKARAAINQLNDLLPATLPPAQLPSSQSSFIKKPSIQPFTTQSLIKNEPILLLTADTIGVLSDGSTILTKPINQEDAINMWQKMSGGYHDVYTAVQATLISPCQRSKHYKVLWQQQILEKTRVTFINLDLQQMQNYWATKEPSDKAGGYAIQGRAAAWVASINGSYTNVVGLPLAQTLALINKAKQAIKSSSKAV